MSNTILLAGSGLLLLAYVLDVFCRRWRLPAVVLLIGCGMLVQWPLGALPLARAALQETVSVLGTIGLVLIVLEGALDIRLARDKITLIRQAGLMAVTGILLCTAVLATAFALIFNLGLFHALILAVPFSVISSAVAIPSAAHLSDSQREFVIYETSISDIVGVLLFFALLASNGSAVGFLSAFIGGGLLSLLLAAVISILLFGLLNHLRGHVRFVPLLTGLFFLYAVAKTLHLSPLMFVLIGGLALNNLPQLTGIAWVARLYNQDYEHHLEQFKGFVCELTFAVRSVFFMMLGFWTELPQLLTWQAWLLALLILLVIYVARWLLLRCGNGRWQYLLWLAPRGLITVLLMLAAQDAVKLNNFPFGSVMLVVLISSILVWWVKTDQRPEPSV